MQSPIPSPQSPSPGGPLAAFARKLAAGLLAPGARPYAGSGAGAYYPPGGLAGGGSTAGPSGFLAFTVGRVDDRAPAAPMVPVATVGHGPEVMEYPPYFPPIDLGSPVGLPPIGLPPIDLGSPGLPPWGGTPGIVVPVPDSPLGPPGHVQDVPEPASVVMMLIGGLVIAGICEVGRRRESRLSNKG